MSKEENSTEESTNHLDDLVQKYGLNVRQARFAILVHGTYAPTVAYSIIYKGEVPEVDSKPYLSSAAAASRLLKNDKVIKAIDALNDGEEILCATSRKEKRSILAMIVRRQIPGVKPVDICRAIREDNLMTGEHRDTSDIDDLTGGDKRLLVELVLKSQES